MTGVVCIGTSCATIAWKAERDDIWLILGFLKEAPAGRTDSSDLCRRVSRSIGESRGRFTKFKAIRNWKLQKM